MLGMIVRRLTKLRKAVFSSKIANLKLINQRNSAVCLFVIFKLFKLQLLYVRQVKQGF